MCLYYEVLTIVCKLAYLNSLREILSMKMTYSCAKLMCFFSNDVITHWCILSGGVLPKTCLSNNPVVQIINPTGNIYLEKMCTSLLLNLATPRWPPDKWLLVKCLAYFVFRPNSMKMIWFTVYVDLPKNKPFTFK